MQATKKKSFLIKQILTRNENQFTLRIKLTPNSQRLSFELQLDLFSRFIAKNEKLKVALKTIKRLNMSSCIKQTQQNVLIKSKVVFQSLKKLLYSL